MKFINFILLSSLILSCNPDIDKTIVLEGKSEPGNSQWRPLKRKNLNEPERVALSFYENYLSNYYNKEGEETPTIAISADSAYYLDTIPHIKFLEQLGTFSSSYYKNQLTSYNACRAELLKIKLGQLDGPPGGDCTFLTYKVWVGGQGEDLNTADIISSTINNSSAQVTLAIGDSIGKYVFSYPKVEMIKENEQWKISNIKVYFDKPGN